MHYFAIFVLLLAVIEIGCAETNNYVVPGSIQCKGNTGVYFELSKDPKTSDLYNQTHLEIDLYTSGHHKKIVDADFNIQSGKVDLSFKDYEFDATIQYGPNKKPLLYLIEQPFYAVPKSGLTKRNYTFAVYCTVPAVYPVHIINKTDESHVDHRNNVIIDPSDHVAVNIVGLRSDNTSKLGDSLIYTVFLKDSAYASLLPDTCNFFNPNNPPLQKMPFVTDKCPRIFPPDPESFVTTMIKVNEAKYEIHFRAFSFDPYKWSVLGIRCTLQLCIAQNRDSCDQPCWGGPTPTPTPTSLTSPPPTTFTVSNTFHVAS